MAKKEGEIEKLGAVLEKSLKRLELSTSLEEYGIWPIWDDTVGPTIARNAQPEKIRHGTLFVKVSSPMWMQQLQYMKELLSDKLNQRLHREVVKNIFFVVGRIDAPSPNPQAQEPAADPLSPTPLNAANEYLESVTNPDIRQALKKLFAAHVRRRAKK